MVLVLGLQPLPWGLELLLTEDKGDNILWSCFWTRSVEVSVPSRQLHSCSRGAALVTPAKAARGDILARASCCPKARHGSAEPAASPGLAWSQLSARLPEEAMQKGGRKEKFPLKNSSDSRRAARVRPIDYTLISVSFVPLLEGTLCGQRNPLSGLRAVVEQGLVQPLGTEAANSGLAGPNQKS